MGRAAHSPATTAESFQATAPQRKHPSINLRIVSYIMTYLGENLPSTVLYMLCMINAMLINYNREGK